MHVCVYLLLFTCVFLYFYGRSLLEAFRRRRRLVTLINRIPGPPSAPLVGSVLNFSPNSEKFTYQMEYYFRVFAEGRKNDGLMKMWIGPVPIIILTRAETIKTILESQTLISKPPEYGVIKTWLGEGLLTSTGEKWYQRRKILTPTFHFSILQNFIPIFNRQTDVMLHCMEKHEDGRKFDFYPFIKLAALDIISETAMGVNLNSQLGENEDYVHAVRRLSELIWHQMRFPWLWLKPVWYGTGMGYEFDECLEVIEGMSNKVIVERKRHLQEDKENYNYQQNGKQKLAFLDLLLEMQEENKLSDKDIREEVDTFMFEGHDTVSSTMGFFVATMGQMLDIQDKLYAELDEIFQGEERDVTMEDLNKMKYLEQCMKETIRILPTVPMIGRRITEDTTVNGYDIPAGVTVMVAPFATQRDPRFYTNPDIFDPDNFSLEKISKRSPYSFLPFSAGPRNCIGQKFAMMEQKILLSKLFRKYRVISTLSELENRGLPELILKPSKGFPIRIEPRV